MSDYLKDPDTGMTVTAAIYQELFGNTDRVGERKIPEVIDDATVAVESLRKSLESDKE